MSRSARASTPVFSLTTLLLVLAGGILICNLVRYSGCLIDDTYISLRYARNLVQGHGPVFNPDERVEVGRRQAFDRVEGYTNPSFVMLAALFLRCGLDPIPWLRGVLLLALLAALWGTVRLERLALPAAVPGLPVSLVLLAPLQALAFWAVCPMETMLFTALLVWGVLLAIEESRSQRLSGAAVVFALLTLTRPEGIALFVVATTATACHERLRADCLQVRRHVVNIVIFSAFLAPHLLWRYWYYGAWLPNTLSAKTTWSRSQLEAGITALKDWMLVHPLLVLGLAAPLLMLLLPRRTWSPAERSLLTEG
jgi:hypothetical protein